MPIYINSKGEERETSTMAFTHLQNALNKSKEAGHEANIAALEAEIKLRNPENNQ